MCLFIISLNALCPNIFLLFKIDAQYIVIDNKIPIKVPEKVVKLKIIHGLKKGRYIVGHEKSVSFLYSNQQILALQMSQVALHIGLTYF